LGHHGSPGGSRLARMRLLVTAEAVSTGESRDVIVGYTPASTVRDLEAVLQEEFGRRSPHAGVADVIDLAARREQQPDGPGLWLGRERLDPEATLVSTSIHHGAIVGLGGPSSHRAREPQGVVEVRVSSGRGAGRVQRLGIGTWAVGSADHCAIRVAGAPDVAGRVEGGAGGSGGVAPAESARGLAAGVPGRRGPPTGPSVREASVATRAGRRFRRKRPGLSALEQGRQIDPGAPLPLVRLDRVAVTEATTWPEGVVLGVADVLFELGSVAVADASLSPSSSGPELDYNR